MNKLFFPSLQLSVCLAFAGFATSPQAQYKFETGLKNPVLPPEKVTPLAAKGVEQKLNVFNAIRRALTQGSAITIGQIDRDSAEISTNAGLKMFEPRVSVLSKYSKSQALDIYSKSTESRLGEVGAIATIKSPIGTELSLALTKPLGSSGSSSSRATLDLIQPLLRGAGTSIAMQDYRRQLITKEATGRNLDSAKDQIVTATFNAFFALYQQQQALTIAQAGLARATESARISSLQLDAGRIARVDTLQTRADVLRAAIDVESAIAAKSYAQRLLALTLGDPESSSYVVEETLPVMPPIVGLEEVVATAFGERKELALASDDAELLRMALDKAKDDLLPRLDVGLKIEQGIGRSSASGDPLATAIPRGTALALTLEVPLTRSDQKAAKDVAALNIERQRLVVEDLKRRIQNDAFSAVTELSTSTRRSELAATMLELQRTRMTAESEKFRSGRSSSNQMSDAQTALQDAERAYLQSKLDTIRSQFAIDAVMGRTIKQWVK